VPVDVAASLTPVIKGLRSVRSSTVLRFSILRTVTWRTDFVPCRNLGNGRSPLKSCAMPDTYDRVEPHAERVGSNPLGRLFPRINPVSAHER